MKNKEAIEILKSIRVYDVYPKSASGETKQAIDLAIKALEDRPQGEYVDISKLRLMTVEECAGHTLDYAMGWKACIEWIKKGGAE